MKLEHIAIWTNQLEVMKEFYLNNFNGIANQKYQNKAKCFQSYFITFESGARLELMSNPNIPDNLNRQKNKQYLGLIHMAFEVESANKVDELASSFKEKGILILDGPRQTGDGYYEFTILDPDKNRVEIFC